MSKILHIVNSDSLTERLENIDLHGDFMVWREMLCDGPTLSRVGSAEFIAKRKEFLRENYDIDESHYEHEFVAELNKISKTESYDEIILWFEFDLFCHINMLAAINYLYQQHIDQPLYLVCSGRIPGEKELKGLEELSEKQLLDHYNKKIKLSEDDLDMAHFIWQLYCSNHPGKLKPEIRKTSNFKYLSSCMRAHIERYPHVHTGLNTLETNILKLIDRERINSEHHLCGYALNYQGYYGYNESMILKTIEKLRPFFNKEKDQLQLNDKGKHVIAGTRNYYREVKSDERFGGTYKYDFLYNPEDHQLMKL